MRSIVQPEWVRQNRETIQTSSLVRRGGLELLDLLEALLEALLPLGLVGLGVLGRC